MKITIEGYQGEGKTQIADMLIEWLRDRHAKVTLIDGFDRAIRYPASERRGHFSRLSPELHVTIEVKQ